MRNDLSNASVVLAVATILSFVVLLFLIFLASSAAATAAITPVAIFGGAAAIGLGCRRRAVAEGVTRLE